MIAPQMVASKLTCSLFMKCLLSRTAPRILSIKQPKVPEITEIFIAIKGSEMIPNRNEAIPIIPAPTIAAEVPKMDIAPSVPGGTFLKVVIKRGSWRTPISLANVSAVAVATAPMNPPAKGR